MSVIYWIDKYFVVIGSIVFLAIIIVTYWPGRRQEIEENAGIPLKERD